MPHQVVYRSALNLDTVCNYRVGVVKTLNNNYHIALNKYWFALDLYGRAIVNETNKDCSYLFFENSLDAKYAADKHVREHFGVKSGANSHHCFKD